MPGTVQRLRPPGAANERLCFSCRLGLQAVILLWEAPSRVSYANPLLKKAEIAILGKPEVEYSMVGSRSSLAIFLLIFGALLSSLAQDNSPNRIQRAIDPTQRMILSGSAHPLAKPAFDVGRVDGNMKMHGVSLVFKPSPAQQTALEELLGQQQDRSSPNYHNWLTPQQYADRFALTSADVGKVTSWLRSEGFSIDRVARSRTQVSFSGTVAQVEAAFRTEFHHYLIDGEIHFANATDLSLPAALVGTVRSVRNLHDFHLKSHYTDGSGNHSIAPDDFATIYDLKPLYAKGFDGAGQSIAVIGQTGIYTTDIDAFRSAAGLPARTSSNFQQFQVLNSGSATPTLANLTDADIGLEWSQAVAPQATILYFFIGDNPNFTAFDALQDAIDNNLAPVISITNGKCEASLGSTEVLTVQGWARQANSQGQTIVAAAGDEGAADCDGKVASAMLGLAVDAPASIPEVTGVGGTEFNGDDPSSTTTYWNTTNTATGGSALSYIPEGVWNDTLFNSVLSAGGGGASIIFAKPTWQVATNVPADGVRDVPDISLAASPDHDPHLLCSNNFCKVGFTDGNGNLPIDLQIAGGTSVSAPTFAGIVAIINQVTGSRQGNINPTLYSLSVSTPSAFHDIISNSNVVPCTVGTPDCQSNGSMGFVADVGYDQASGLGSVDANVFVNAWPLDFSITANPNRFAIPTGATGTSTITLNPIGSFSGTVSLACTTPSGIALTCAISPPTVTTANPNATLTVSAFGPGAASSAKSRLGFGGPVGSSFTSLAGSFPTAFYQAALLSLFLFAFLVAGLRSARSKPCILSAFGLLSITTVIILIPACGSHSSGSGSFCTTAPSVPTGLAASSTTPTGTSLNWTAASAGANCSVNSYAVFQNGTSIGTTTTTNMTVTGLSPATPYSFTVAAGDAAGVSAQSSPLSVTTPSPTPAGNYSITIKATSGTAVYSTTVTVAVQ
jgi:pro-kumamolisin-like protein/fibronectin type III domain protein